MSQLMLRVLRPFSRAAPFKMTYQQPIQASPRSSILYTIQQISGEIRSLRAFSQQAVEADAGVIQPLGERTSLFASPDESPISMRDMREDTSMVHYIQTGKSLTEQLSVMQACLMNGNVERAQRILIGMYKLYPKAMKDVADVSVHNEILGGLMAAKPQPLSTEALLWYDQMERLYMVKPNANTFAILIRGFVGNGMQNVGVVLMQEMLRSGHSFHDMLLSSYLSDKDIDSIRDVARGILNRGAENTDVATKLLDAVHAADIKLKDLENDPNGISSSNDADLHTTAENDTEGSKAAKGSVFKLHSSKVLGITQLKDTLQSLYTNELDGYNLQMRLERDTYDAAIARSREINKQRGDPLLQTDISRLKKLTATWLPQLEALIEEEQGRCLRAKENAGNDRVREQYGKFFSWLDAPKIAIITILEALRLNAIEQRTNSSDMMPKFVGVKTITLVTSLSSAVHDEIRFQRMKDRTNRHIIGRNMSVAKLASSGKLFNMAVRRVQAHQMRANSNQEWLDSWDVTTKTRIGSLLISMLIEVARIEETSVDPVTGETTTRMAPAFTHDYIVNRGRKYGVIIPHNLLREMFKEDSIASTVSARHLPMLVPPRPWLTYNTGGYLTHDEPCMRMKESNEQLRYLKVASNEDRLYTLLAGLDSLGLTKWAINRTVFDAVRKVWNSGVELAEIPASSYDVPEPTKPADFDTNDKAKLKYSFELREWRNGSSNQHSRRCDCNYKVEIAQAFLNHPMYFPHNMDFRGRAYPIPPHFNHLGNDLCRGLLLFDEGRPLTERGVYWLKIHLANLYGKDKLSHEDRVSFVDESYDRIIESADNPVPDSLLSGDTNTPRPWWLEASDPWQALSACIEFAAAMRSPNPAEYVSRLHIHQDGTCNGLQHYAAMGRDRKGAREVNLIPSEKPQDVYQGILNVVNRLIDEDADNGVKEAVVLKGKLTRKIVKQTVMTNVYGVTLIGAREQISARLREVKDEHGDHEFELVDVSKLALYVAKKIFDSLGEMFTQAQEIQNWLNESARRIAKSMPKSALSTWKRMILESKQSQVKLREALRDAKDNDRVLENEKVLELRPDLGPGSTRRKRLNTLATKPMTTVVWTTPLGLTVVQPYRKFAMRHVATALQSISVRDANMPSPVNSQKQKTAFPPNFVHSLDASHMILSAIECKVAGLVFASVHDSYWTHACDIDKMNKILRDQFVQLHKRPIMDDLKAEFEKRYIDHKMPVIRWEYVNKPVGFGAKKKASPVSAKEVREEKERLIEAELAMHHLGICGEADAASVKVDVVQAAAEEEVKPVDVEEVDLSSIDLINPHEDPLGAAYQSDQIHHTLTLNKARLEKESKALRKENMAKIREARAIMKSEEKTKSKAKSVSKKASAAVADKDPATGTTTTIIVKGSKFMPDSTTEAVTLQLEKKVFDIKKELSEKIAAAKKKYITNFEQPQIMLAETQSPDQLKKIVRMIKDRKLAGRLTKRTLWVDIEFDQLPKHGDFDLREVLDSPYFFS